MNCLLISGSSPNSCGKSPSRFSSSESRRTLWTWRRDFKIANFIDPNMAQAKVFEGGILPSLPKDWEGGSKDNPNFKAIGTLSPPVMRRIEPVGPHFLAYARRKRHGRTFSEDERIQAQSRVKKIEDDDSGEISEPEDPLMLTRDAKDWRVSE